MDINLNTPANAIPATSMLLLVNDGFAQENAQPVLMPLAPAKLTNQPKYIEAVQPKRTPTLTDAPVYQPIDITPKTVDTTTTKKDNTLLYVGLGVAALGIGYLLLGKNDKPAKKAALSGTYKAPKKRKKTAKRKAQNHRVVNI